MRGTLTNAWMRCRVNATFASSSTDRRLPIRTGLIYLFETNHPVRYYIPQEDVRMDLLVRSDTTSRCPYKGPASYWSVKLGDSILDDMVWGYMEPIPECPKIKGLLCFFHERGCEIYVDGELVPQPQTKWARALKK